MRAPTPSAAAEIATIDMAEFLASVEERKQRLSRAVTGLITWTRAGILERRQDRMKAAMTDRIYEYRRRSEKMQYSLGRLSPGVRVNALRAQSAEAWMKLSQVMTASLTDARHSLAIKAEKLKGLSPLEKISSGYAWISDEKEKHLSKAAELEKGQNITVRFADGKAVAEVTEVII